MSRERYTKSSVWLYATVWKANKRSNSSKPINRGMLEKNWKKFHWKRRLWKTLVNSHIDLHAFFFCLVFLWYFAVTCIDNIFFLFAAATCCLSTGFMLPSPIPSFLPPFLPMISGNNGQMISAKENLLNCNQRYIRTYISMYTMIVSKVKENYGFVKWF